MSKPLFTTQQIFSLKPKTLQKRIDGYYEDTRDANSTIQYLIALQVRDELGDEGFSFFMKDLVHKLLLQTKTSRILRRYYFYFKDYFSSNEWKVVSIRLFSIKNYLSEKIEKLRDQFIKEPLVNLAGS